MDKERNLKKSATFNYFKSSDKRKEFPYPTSAQRNKRSRFNSPEKQDVVKKALEVVKIAEEVNYDIPDKSFGDLYCKPCNSHMMSEHIWNSHIQGKRHIKNTKRAENEYEFVDQDPIMLPELKKVKKPIIGLQHCCEMLRPDGKPTYQCFLCSANIPNSKLLIEHVTGLKHRMAYLKIHDSINYNIITKSELRKGMMEPLVEEFIQKYAEKHGLGKMRVKVARPTSSFHNAAKPYKEDLTHKTDRNVGNYEDDDTRKESVERSPDWRHSRNTYDDVRSESESPDWRHHRNSYDDVKNESMLEHPDWKRNRSSYDDARNESISENPDRRHVKNSYNVVRNESISENPDRRHGKNSYDAGRNESKLEDSNWRQISGKERDYSSNDKYASVLHHEKSVRQQNHFDKNETDCELLISSPPLNSKTNFEESQTNVYANSTWKKPSQALQREDLRDFLEKKQHEDLRAVLEKKQHEDLRGFLEMKRMMENNTKTVPNITNALEFVFSIIEDLPNMKFLELVYQKVQKMKDPSESEQNMLSKIGKCMFSIVMEKKMDKLTPDLRKKYQSVTNENVNQGSIIRTATPEQKISSKLDFQSLMDLIKNPRRENEKLVNQNFPPQNVSSQLNIAIGGNHQPNYTTASPNFIQSLWGTPSPSSTSSIKDFPAIPGLTLSSEAQYSYSQVSSHEQYAHAQTAWPTIQHKNNINQY